MKEQIKIIGCRVFGFLFFVLISCNSKIKKTDSKMLDFTDEEGNVFVKLYTYVSIKKE